MKTLFLCTALSCATISTVRGQATQFLDAGNIRSLVGTAGHLWWDTATGAPRCEYPKGSGKHVGFNANLWVGGFDAQGQLRVAANTFRQAGNDYWQGPLDANNSSTAASQAAWDKVWKVTKTDLDAFLAQTTHTVANTPDAILRWPARGNTYATGATGSPLSALIGTTDDFAPFIDVNSDGVYNALQGDYPQLRGQQMLWQMYNDGGGTKTQTGTAKLPVQIGLLAWAYSRGTVVDNIQFYEYTLTNRGGQLDSFVVGVYTDVDLGFATDDYIGFDSSRRMGYCYNASAVDGSGQTNSYGSQIPVAGIALLRTAGDAPLAGYRAPAGAFTYFNNFTGLSTIQAPTNGAHFYQYMTGTTRGGDPFTRDFTGQQGLQTDGIGGVQRTRYVFDGDPGVSGAWSECFSENAPGDRRYVLSSSTFSFPAGATRTVAMALVVSPNAGGCPSTTLTGIRQTADSALVLYNSTSAGVTSAEAVAPVFKLFPNPANDQLFISLHTPDRSVRAEIFDAAGRRIEGLPVSRTAAGFSIATSALPEGLYAVRIIGADGGSAAATFVKQ